MLQISYIMIYIIHKISVLLKISRILETSIIHFIFLIIFVTTYNDGKSTIWTKNIIKDVRNLFKLGNLKKERTDAAIKDIKNLLRLEKEKKQLKWKKTRKKQLRIYYLEILEIFLRKKKKKVIINL